MGLRLKSRLRTLVRWRSGPTSAERPPGVDPLFERLKVAGDFYVVARCRRVLNVLSWFADARRDAVARKQTPVLIFRPWGSDRIYLMCDLSDARKVGEAIGRNREKIEDLRELAARAGEQSAPP